MKILIVKTSSLGDIVHAFPVLEYLHRRYPKAMIDWVVEKPFVELVQSHPYVNEVFAIQTKKWRRAMTSKETFSQIKSFAKQLRGKSYDMVFDLQGNVKSGLVTKLAKSPVKVGFGWQTVPERPNMLFTNRRYNPPQGRNIREDYLYLVQSYCGPLDYKEEGIRLSISLEDQAKIEKILSHPHLIKGPKMMVCIGSNWPNKQLSIATLKAFLKKIREEYLASFIFIWGTDQEKKDAEDLSTTLSGCSVVIDKLSLPALQNLMSRLDLVIAMDSLPLHLAGTTSTPTYSVFGASLAAKYKPNGPTHQAFQGTCPYGQVFTKRCSRLRTCSTGACVKEVSIDALFNHFKERKDL